MYYRSAELDVPLDRQVHIKNHVGEGSRKPDPKKESVYTLVVEAVEILEVVGSREQ